MTAILQNKLGNWTARIAWPLLVLLVTFEWSARAETVPVAVAPSPTTVSTPITAPGKNESGAVQRYDLKEFVDAVMTRDPNIISARLAADATHYTYLADRVSYFPKLTANGQVTWIKGASLDPLSNGANQNGKSGPGQSNISSSGASNNPNVEGFTDGGGGLLSVPLFQDGTFMGLNTPPKAGISLALDKVAQANITLTRDQIRYQTIQIYLQAVSGARQVRLLKQEAQAIKQQEQTLVINQKYNLVSEEQIKACQDQLDQVNALLQQAQWLTTSALIQVAFVLGVENPSKIQIKNEYPPLPTAPDFRAVLTRALVSHPNLTTQQAVLEEAKASHALAQSAVMPKVVAVGGYAWADDFDPPGQDRWLSEVLVTMPVFDFGDNYFKVRSTTKTMESEKVKLMATKEALVVSLQASYTALQAANVNYATSKVGLSQKEILIKQDQIMAQTGQVAMATFLSDQIAYDAAALAADSSYYSLLLAFASLQQASSNAYEWSLK